MGPVTDVHQLPPLLRALRALVVRDPDDQEFQALWDEAYGDVGVNPDVIDSSVFERTESSLLDPESDDEKLALALDAFVSSQKGRDGSANTLTYLMNVLTSHPMVNFQSLAVTGIGAGYLAVWLNPALPFEVALASPNGALRKQMLVWASEALWHGYDKKHLHRGTTVRHALQREYGILMPHMETAKNSSFARGLIHRCYQSGVPLLDGSFANELRIMLKIHRLWWSSVTPAPPPSAIVLILQDLVVQLDGQPALARYPTGADVSGLSATGRDGASGFRHQIVSRWETLLSFGKVVHVVTAMYPGASFRPRCTEIGGHADGLE